MEGHVASILNEKLLAGMYASYLSKIGVVLMDIRQAVDKYREIIDEIISRHGDRKVFDPAKTPGVFVYVPRGTRIETPIYACFLLGEKGFYQRIINVIKIEDGAEITLAKGCAALVPTGAHKAMSLIEIGDNAGFTSIMIHNWRPGIDVSSATYARVGRKSLYRSYYVKTTPVRSIGSYEEVEAGEATRVEIHKASTAPRGTRVASTAVINLKGRNSSGLIVTRGVVENGGFMINELKMNARADNVKGHMECMGLVLGEGVMRTLPVLETSVENATLTHEASIGRIGGEQLFYLMTRGLTEEEAVRLIVGGFLRGAMEGLPPQVKSYMDRIINMMAGKIVM